MINHYFITCHYSLATLCVTRNHIQPGLSLLSDSSEGDRPLVCKRIGGLNSRDGRIDSLFANIIILSNLGLRTIAAFASLANISPYQNRTPPSLLKKLKC